jgi:hypothetical protein
MLWMGRVRLHYISGDEVNPHVDFFTFTNFLESCNLYNNIRHKQVKLRLSFAFSYGM